MSASTHCTVEDVVRSPALQLSVLAGAAGLGRSVSWAHVSELADPRPWLLGSEIIMTTGLAIPKSGAGQRAYLERLDDAGVAALALSEQLHVPVLRKEFLAAADRRGMPVLEVPLPVPFIAIAQEVAAAVQADMGQRLGAQLQVFGALRWITVENLEIAEIFSRLERLSGYDLYLCTPQSRPLLPGVRTPGPSEASLLPLSPAAPPTVPGGFVLPVQAPGGTAGYLLAQGRYGAQPAGLAVVQHIATVASLLLTIVRHERETLRREGAETLSELLSHALPPQTRRRRLLRAGFAAEGRVVLVVLRARKGPPDESDLLGRLHEAQLPYLLLRQQEGFLLLLPADPIAAQVLADHSGPNDVSGSSRPFDQGDSLDIARREARWAAARAVDAGQTHVTYGDHDTAAWWLPEDRHVLAAVTERVLGPALAYDQANGTNLVASVRSWLECGRRTDEAAGILHIHANTLSYRLRRFSQISERDLAATGDLAEVWLALKAHRHLDGET